MFQITVFIDFLRVILAPIKFFTFRMKWRRINQHNFTIAGNRFPVDKVAIGKATYGVINVLHTQNPAGMLNIGNYCSIADGVNFLLSGEHDYKCVSTYPFKVKICGKHMEARTKGTIKVSDDVWIGQNAIILSGVTLGQGCIIGAGSIVRKNIPPYAIFASDQIIKYRFSQETINNLVNIDFSKLDYNSIENNIDLLYSKDINEFLESDLYKKIIN